MKKKIAILTQNYYPKIGGTETLAKTILTSLQDEYEVDLITSKVEDRNLFNFSHKVFEFSENDFLNLDIFFKVKKYDLCIFFSDLHSIQLNKFKNIWCDKTIVVLNLDENSYSWKDNFPSALQNLKKSSMVITFTKEGVANKFLEENNIKNTYIPNFSKDYKTSKEDLDIKLPINLKQDTKTIGYIASYEQRKNQLFVLEKISENKNLRDLNFLFMGTSPDLNYLKECINLKNKNNLDNVHFIKGTNEQQKIKKLLNNIDCLLLCSLAEGLPLSILEAMSAGKPWVATPVGGIRGVFKNTNSGFVLSSKQPTSEEIYNNITKCISELNSQIIREEWHKEFDVTKSVKAYKEMVKEVLK